MKDKITILGCILVLITLMRFVYVKQELICDIEKTSCPEIKK